MDSKLESGDPLHHEGDSRRASTDSANASSSRASTGTYRYGAENEEQHPLEHEEEDPGSVPAFVTDSPLGTREKQPGVAPPGNRGTTASGTTGPSRAVGELAGSTLVPSLPSVAVPTWMATKLDHSQSTGPRVAIAVAEKATTDEQQQLGVRTTATNATLSGSASASASSLRQSWLPRPEVVSRRRRHSTDTEGSAIQGLGNSDALRNSNSSPTSPCSGRDCSLHCFVTFASVVHTMLVTCGSNSTLTDCEVQLLRQQLCGTALCCADALPAFLRALHLSAKREASSRGMISTITESATAGGARRPELGRLHREIANEEKEDKRINASASTRSTTTTTGKDMKRQKSNVARKSAIRTPLLTALSTSVGGECNPEDSPRGGEPTVSGGSASAAALRYVLPEASASTTDLVDASFESNDIQGEENTPLEGSCTADEENAGDGKLCIVPVELGLKLVDLYVYLFGLGVLRPSVQLPAAAPDVTSVGVSTPRRDAPPTALAVANSSETKSGSEMVAATPPPTNESPVGDVAVNEEQNCTERQLENAPQQLWEEVALAFTTYVDVLEEWGRDSAVDDEKKCFCEAFRDLELAAVRWHAALFSAGNATSQCEISLAPIRPSTLSELSPFANFCVPFQPQEHQQTAGIPATESPTTAPPSPSTAGNSTPSTKVVSIPIPGLGTPPDHTSASASASQQQKAHWSWSIPQRLSNWRQHLAVPALLSRRSWEAFAAHRVGVALSSLLIMTILACVGRTPNTATHTIDTVFLISLIVGVVLCLFSFLLAAYSWFQAREKAAAAVERQVLAEHISSAVTEYMYLALALELTAGNKLPGPGQQSSSSVRGLAGGISWPPLSPPVKVPNERGATEYPIAATATERRFLGTTQLNASKEGLLFGTSNSFDLEGSAKSGGSAAQSTTTMPPTDMTTLLPSMNEKRDRLAVPTPLLIESLLDDDTVRPSGAGMVEPTVVSVQIDPTGTFVLPFLEEGTPILVDGQHIHTHLAVIGVEFSEQYCNASREQRLAADDDPFQICLWNHAMGEATGGYTAQTALQLSLGQVLADQASFQLVQSMLRQAEDALRTPEAPLCTDSFVLRVVHKDQGICRMQMTLAPVLRGGGEIVSGGGGGAGGETDVLSGSMMVGALLLGVPIDPRTALSTYAYRTLYLSEVLEQFLLEARARGTTQAGASCRLSVSSFTGISSPNLPVRSKLPPVPALDGTATFTSTGTGTAAETGGGSGESPSLAQPSCPKISSAELNEAYSLFLLRELSCLETIDDCNWESVYNSTLKQLLLQTLEGAPFGSSGPEGSDLSFSATKSRGVGCLRSTQCTVSVDESVPLVFTCDLNNILQLLKQLVHLCPPSDSGFTAKDVENLRKASSGSSASMSASAREGRSFTSERLNITLSTPTTDSPALVFHIAGLQLDNLKLALSTQLAQLGSQEEPVLQAKGGGGEGLPLLSPAAHTLLALVIDLHALILFTEMPQGVHNGSISSNSAAEQPSPLSALSSESIFLFVPFKASTGIQTNWLRAATLAQSTPTATSLLTPSRRRVPATISGTGGRSGEASKDGGTGHPTGPLFGSEFAVSVLVAEKHDISRQKLVRALWDHSHSVCTVDEGGSLLEEGLQILRSGLRRVEAVIFRPWEQTSFLGGGGLLADLVREFSEVQFIALQPKQRKQNIGLRSSRERRASTGGSPGLPLAAPFMDSTATDAYGTTEDSEIEQEPSWEQQPNVHLVEVGRASFVEETLKALSSIVRAARKEKAKKLELEKVFKEHRGSTWVKGKKLGGGAFGDVYEAEMTMTGGKMAVKVLRVPPTSPEEGSHNNKAIDAIVNEIGVMCSMTHPNIVRYFYCEVGADGNVVNLMMELCEGGSLAALMENFRKQKKRLNETEVGTYVAQMLSALAYLHTQGYAHRDIKPANILLSQGQVKLADFGTAKSLTAEQKVTETAGTFRYMAPEIIQGAEHSKSCDIWSIGCVVLELLGSLPPTSKFHGSFDECRSDEDLQKALLLHLEEVGRHMTHHAINFALACLKQRPEQRPTAEELLHHDFVLNAQRTVGLSRRASVLFGGTMHRHSGVYAVGSMSSPAYCISGELSIRSEAPEGPGPAHPGSLPRRLTSPIELGPKKGKEKELPAVAHQHSVLSISSEASESMVEDHGEALITSQQSQTFATKKSLSIGGFASLRRSSKPPALSEALVFEEHQNVWRSHALMSSAQGLGSSGTPSAHRALASPAHRQRRAKQEQALNSGSSVGAAPLLSSGSAGKNSSLTKGTPSSGE